MSETGRVDCAGFRPPHGVDGKDGLPALVTQQLENAQQTLSKAASDLEAKLASLIDDNQALRAKLAGFSTSRTPHPPMNLPYALDPADDDPPCPPSTRLADCLRETPEPLLIALGKHPSVTHSTLSFLNVPEETIDEKPSPRPVQTSVKTSQKHVLRRAATRQLKDLNAVLEGDESMQAHNSHAVFADAEDMKAQVRLALAKGEYDVKNYYSDQGWAQLVARSGIFELATLSIIAANAIWIAIDVDNNHAETLNGADPVFQVVEHFFCVYFTAELVIRFLAFREKRNCLRDAWFVFDSALCCLMIFETWFLSIVLGLSGQSGGLGGGSVLKLLRLCKLTRMARMAKLLRAVPELVILVKGMLVASRSVFFTLVLLIVIIYFFAIVFRQLTDDTYLGKKYYPTVPSAMSSLLLDYILPDQSASISDHGNEHLGLGFVTVLYYLLAGMTVMNMLVGVLVEVVSVVSSVEKEQLTVSYVKTKLDRILVDTETTLDTDGNKTISKAEFQRLLVIPEVAKIIHEIGVDVYALVDISDYIFETQEEIDFPAFMELVLQLRGNNVATVKDIVDLRKFLSTELIDMENRFMEHFAAEEKSLQTLLQKSRSAKTLGGKAKSTVFGMAGLSV